MSEFPAPDVKMPRRRFLATAAPALAGAALARCVRRPKLSVMTVRGRIDAERLGATLMHEHVMVDFIGADKVSRNRYDPEQVFTTALPHLRSARRSWAAARSSIALPPGSGETFRFSTGFPSPPV